MNRRNFFHLSIASATSLGFLGLRHLSCAQDPAPHSGYGPLRADPDKILELPNGFSYKVVSKVGDAMDDGLVVPGRMDGMGAFPGKDGTTILIRNHESHPGLTTPAFKDMDEVEAQKKHFYDFGKAKTPHTGGTTTIVYDTAKHKVLQEYQSLFGTIRNCAGGCTPWNTWISCEEVVIHAGTHPLFGFESEKSHGYNFEVPSTGIAEPIPLKDMGRFNHEAVAVDPKTGIVYQTEDRHEGLFYRFIPKTPGKLADGGKLQALAIRDQKSADTRNWEKKHRIEPGTILEVEWIDCTAPESPKDTLRFDGFKDGAARFARGEGIWHSDRGFFFACTNGGKKKLGQIFRYQPSPAEGTAEEANQPGTLELFIEPNDAGLVENADNLTVAPWGDLIVCEDKKGTCRLIGVTPKGECYTLASAVAGGELAGATFSPDGKTLFVNLQIAGYTVAIQGPWS